MPEHHDEIDALPEHICAADDCDAEATVLSPLDDDYFCGEHDPNAGPADEIARRSAQEGQDARERSADRSRCDPVVEPEGFVTALGPLSHDQCRDDEAERRHQQDDVEHVAGGHVAAVPRSSTARRTSPPGMTQAGDADA